ncbi:hypothetical protein HDE_05951 [Halotydeus destructor]|nr:hypothetical protein HDE_05951 [Halotydeus destructor]
MFNDSVLLVVLVTISGYVILTNGAENEDKTCSAEASKEEVESYECMLKTIDPKMLKIEKDCLASVNMTFPTTAQMSNVHMCKASKDKEYAAMFRKSNECSILKYKEGKFDMKAENEKLKPRVVQIETECYASVNATFPTSAQMYNLEFCKISEDKEYAKLIHRVNACTKLKFEENKIDIQDEMAKSKLCLQKDDW